MSTADDYRLLQCARVSPSPDDGLLHRLPTATIRVSARSPFDAMPSALVACVMTGLALSDHGRFARTSRLARRVSLLACASPVEIVLDGKATGKPRVPGGSSMRFAKPPAMPALYRYRPRRLHFPSFWAVLEDADGVHKLTQMTSVEELALEPHLLLRYPHDQSRVFGGHPGALAVAALELVARNMPQLRRLTLYGGDVSIEGLAVLPPLLERLCVSGIARDERDEWVTALARRVPALADFEIDQGFGRRELVRFVRALPRLRRLLVRCVLDVRVADDDDDTDDAAGAGPGTTATSHAVPLGRACGLAQLTAFGTSWRSRSATADNCDDDNGEVAENVALWSRMRLPNATEINLGVDSAGVSVAVIMAACGCPPATEGLVGTEVATKIAAATAITPGISDDDDDAAAKNSPPPPPTDLARHPALGCPQGCFAGRTRGIDALHLTASRVSGGDLTRMIATDFVHRTCRTLEFAMPVVESVQRTTRSNERNSSSSSSSSSGPASDVGFVGDDAFDLAPLRHFSALTDLTLREYRGHTLPELATLLRLTVDVESSRADEREAVVIVAAAPLPALAHLCYRGESVYAADASAECRERARRRSRAWSAAVVSHMPELREVDVSGAVHVAWDDLADLAARLPRLYRIRLDAATHEALRRQSTTHIVTSTDLRNSSGLERLRAAATAAGVALV